MSGDAPCVQFIDGRERSVEGGTITIVPLSVYDAEVSNRLEITHWLTIRIHRVDSFRARYVPMSRIDLTKVMAQHAQSSSLPSRETTSPSISVL